MRAYTSCKFHAPTESTCKKGIVVTKFLSVNASRLAQGQVAYPGICQRCRIYRRQSNREG